MHDGRAPGAGGPITVAQSVEIWLPVTETWLYNEVRYLPAWVRNHVVCEATENLELFPGADLHSLARAPRPRYYLDKGLRWLGLRRHLGFLVEQGRRHGVQLIHSHFGHIGWANLGAAAALGAKHVTTFYGHDVNHLPKRDPRWLERYRALFAKVDRILCEGPHMADCLIAMGCPAGKVSVHHLGVAVEEIPYRPRRWQPDQPLKVLIAASFREKKGIPYAIEALGKLQREVPVELTIIGDANSEPRSQAEKRRILSAIEHSGLGGRVRSLGYQPYTVLMDEAYRHHLFLSPSVTAGDGDTEGGAPVSLIEMMASGMPIVSSWHCDIPHVLKQGEAGLLAPERDVDGILEQLRLLVHDPGRWDGMLLAGRRRVELEFNARVQGEKLGEVYRDLVGLSPSGAKGDGR